MLSGARAEQQKYSIELKDKVQNDALQYRLISLWQ